MQDISVAVSAAGAASERLRRRIGIGSDGVGCLKLLEALMTRLASLIFTASLFVACTSTRPLDEGMTCPCAPGWSCDTITNLCVTSTGGTSASDGGSGAVGTGGSGPTLFTAAQVQSALANCDLPHGPAVTINNSDDVKARVIGTWLLCTATAAGEPTTRFAPGIQFEPDGSFEVLTPHGRWGIADRRRRAEPGAVVHLLRGLEHHHGYRLLPGHRLLRSPRPDSSRGRRREPRRLFRRAGIVRELADQSVRRRLASGVLHGVVHERSVQLLVGSPALKGLIPWLGGSACRSDSDPSSRSG